MTEPASLTVEDVRDVFRIVTECRELGDDSLRWRQHLLVRAIELIGARVGLSGEMPLLPIEKYPGPPQVEIGWASPEEAQRCHEYWKEDLPNNPFWQRAWQALGPIATFLRQPFVEDDEWYGLPSTQNVLRPSNVDGPLVSVRLCENLTGWRDQILLMYSWGDRQPAERDRDLLKLLHDEIAPLVGGPLAARGEPAPSDLPRRKQQVLECVLLGATDKQIAKALKLSRPTVSEYVSEILRHFDVSSRSELLAVFLQRYRRPRCGELR